MNSEASAEEIRRRMSKVRGQLGGEVAEIVDHGRQLVNWRHYVQVFPWASLAAAAALGYFAVPRRLEIISPDAEELEKLAKDNRLVVEHRPRGSEKPSAVASLANLTGNMLLRAGLAYAGQHMGQLLGNQADAPVGNDAVTQ